MEVGLRGIVAWAAGVETAPLGCGVSDPQAVASTLARIIALHVTRKRRDPSAIGDHDKHALRLDREEWIRVMEKRAAALQGR